jgi:hypothetical protein
LDLNTNIHDFYFYNNVFSELALQASCGAENVHFFNNLIYASGTGHVPLFGRRWYDTTNAWSGILIADDYYRVSSSTGSDEGGTIVYDGDTLDFNTRFWATNGITYTTNGDVVIKHQWASRAHGAKMLNNMLIMCGSGSTNNGWYIFFEDLTNIVADYNMVSKSNWLAVKPDLDEIAVGTPGGGWNNGVDVDTDWYEVHGINGGDPIFVDAANFNWRLQTNSPGIDAGTNLTAYGLTDDFFGQPRSGTWDMGPFEGGVGGGDEEESGSTNTVHTFSGKQTFSGKSVFQ